MRDSHLSKDTTWMEKCVVWWGCGILIAIVPKIISFLFIGPHDWCYSIPLADANFLSDDI